MGFSRRPGLRFNRGRMPVRAAATGGGGDTDPPSVSSIVINSDGVTGRMTFSEAMNTTSPPAAASLTFGSSTRSTFSSSSWFSSTQLDFTMATHRVMGSTFETPTLSYTPGANPLEDAAGNDLSTFSNAAVTNNSTHAPMVHVETRFETGATTWTSPADLYDTSCSVELWGGGEAATTNTGSGRAAYYCQKNDTIAANTGYNESNGVGGTAPGGAGADSTWRTNVCVAPGGGSATSPVGDVTRAGTSGSAGTGARAGGATSGTSTAASGSTAGEPNGSPSFAGADRPARIPGTGGASTTTTQRDGAQGIRRLQVLRAPPLPGPYVCAVAEYRDAAAAVTRDLAAPGTHVAGDIVVVVASLNGAATPACAQATEVNETVQATNLTAAVYARTADGSDTLTVTSTNTSGVYRVYRIRGANGIGNVEVTATTGTASAPNGGTHTPTGGSLQRLVIAFAAVRASTNASHLLNGMPSNYHGMYTPARSDANAAGLVTGSKLEAAASYTPGAFGTNAIQQWVAGAISVE